MILFPGPIISGRPSRTFSRGEGDGGGYFRDSDRVGDDSLRRSGHTGHGALTPRNLARKISTTVWWDRLRPGQPPSASLRPLRLEGVPRGRDEGGPCSGSAAFAASTVAALICMWTW